MSESLRALAEAEAEKRYEGFATGGALNLAETAFSAGFIAGRTSVTREQIAAALAEPGAMGVQSHDLRQADRVLALLNGEVAGDE